MCSQGWGWTGRADGTLGEEGPHPLTRAGSPDPRIASQICLSRRFLVTYLLGPRAAWSWSSGLELGSVKLRASGEAGHWD